MKQEEVDIYIKQFIESYRWYGRVYPSLDEVRELMPRSSIIYDRISRVMYKLSGECTETSGSHEGDLYAERNSETGTGVMDMEAVIKSIPAELGVHDVRMTILHTAVAGMEKKGTISESALDLMADELVDLTNTTTKHAIGKKNKGLIKQYEEIQKLSEGKKRDKRIKTVRGEVRKDLKAWMLGMSVYTEIAGADSALRMSEDIVGDLFRLIIRRFATKISEDGVDRDICLSFMSGLDIPEAGLCMLRCFMADDIGRDKKRIPGGIYLHVPDMVINRKKSIRLLLGRGAGVVAVIMLMGIMVTGMMYTKTDDKESRLRQAMTGAMKTTVEKMDDLTQTNALMAVFMQRMLSLVDDDVDLTVRICELDKEDHEIEVEAVGEYEMSGDDRRRVAVRRRISF